VLEKRDIDEFEGTSGTPIHISSDMTYNIYENLKV